MKNTVLARFQRLVLKNFRRSWYISTEDLLPTKEATVGPKEFISDFRLQDATEVEPELIHSYPLFFYNRNYTTASLPAALRCFSGGDGHIAHSGINRRRRWLVSSLHPFGLTSKKARSTHDDGSISASVPSNIIRKRVTRHKDKKKPQERN
jgi:hypothetical protein